ncbi:hypothetical protein RJ641_008218 [Dillenia turbinata]|uniref:Uncharacterized protein n=1 Tax=Dillenia turbinata TaxID=194707 RepID=A0AAN8V4I7_9MAGN
MPAEMSDEKDVAEDEMSNEEDRAEDFTGLGLSEDHDPETSDNENTSDVEGEEAPSLEHVLNDLDSFDMDNGLALKQVTGRKKPQSAAHKLHEKPQKKKDRSWRVGSDGSDGMPAARVFQKPVNTGPRKL